MPTEIVIVRHGQCTGNVADRASFKGNHSLFTEELRQQKSSLWPLTPAGIKESELAGNWIRNNITNVFDHYFRSDYLRAIETAEHMRFDESHWIESLLLRERQWAGSENLPYPEREKFFESFGVPTEEDSLFWSPPNGEAMIAIIKKMELFLDEARRMYSGKRILLVSHGAPLQAFRVLQHQIEPADYKSFISGKNYIRNCHIFHYSNKKTIFICHANLNTCLRE